MGTVPFEAMDTAELRFITQWDRFFYSVRFAAVAAQTVAFQLRNPGVSNVVAVIESMKIQNAAAASTVVLHQQAISADCANPASNFQSFDGRTTRLTSMVGSSAQSAAPNSGVYTKGPMSLDMAANQYVELIQTVDQEFPLTPGQGIEFEQLTANAGITFALWWRERFLEEGERF